MSYIPDNMRQLVIERGENRCEYCMLHEQDSLYVHEVDHIIPEKHRGKTQVDNLCFACLTCNRHKGSDFASFDPDTDQVTLLFNPRTDNWQDHFRLESVRIVPLTAQGRVTVFVLKMNSETRLRERQALLIAGRYPPPDSID